jgi:hypothetical protein
MRAVLLGDRIDTSGLERTDVLSTAPLASRAGQDGVVTVFRYGVVNSSSSGIRKSLLRIRWRW